MSLLDDIRAEADRLEATKRRKGIVTQRMTTEALGQLPTAALQLISPYHIKRVCDALNSALDDAASQPVQAWVDLKGRAAGDA